MPLATSLGFTIFGVSPPASPPASNGAAQKAATVSVAVVSATVVIVSRSFRFICFIMFLSSVLWDLTTFFLQSCQTWVQIV